MENGLYTAHEVAAILLMLLEMIALAISMETMNGCPICANCKRLVRIRAEWLVGNSI